MSDLDRVERLGRRLDLIGNILAWCAAIVFLGISIFAFIQRAHGAELKTFAWRYPYQLHENVTGYKIYMGTAPAAVNNLVGQFTAANTTVAKQSGYLLSESFDQDPAGKYNVTKGSWKWDSTGSKAMKTEGQEFMVVFEYPAGQQSDFGFVFCPEKSLSDQPQLLLYLKDESTAKSSYLELRFAGEDGTRYSNFRKVYDDRFGGVDPAGAFPLPRYKQCYAGELASDVVCDCYWLTISWSPTEYSASAMDTTVGAADDRVFDINKLEIIINNQTGWIDNVYIGGAAELQKQLSVTLPASGTVYFAISAYLTAGGEVRESAKSLPVEFTIGETKPTTPGKPGGLIYLN